VNGMKKRIIIDRNIDTIPTDYSWQFGLGNDHAFQLHRTDVCEHVKLAHDELGIRYLRFHGLFDDDMLTYQRLSDYFRFRSMPYSRHIKEINFRQVGHVLDNLLDCGVKPFVELSFMPTALARGRKIGLRYNNNITLPRSFDSWAEYVRKFIRFIEDRYGKEEIETWYFEVWNEPDLPIFFDGKQRDYFKLYEYTVRAIKDVNENLRVGGPSTSSCRWLDDFITYCEKRGLPCDFVSTHHYVGDAFGNSFSFRDAFEIMKIAKYCARNAVPLGESITRFFFHPEVYRHWEKGALTRMDQEARSRVGDRPLFITEWNSMAVFGAPVHDEKYNAAFIVKTCLDLNGIADAYMFWCCSDIFEELFMLGKPFVGSYGIITSDGIPKPSFWAFKLLSQLYPKRLKLSLTTNDTVEYAAFVDGNKTQVIVYAQDFDYFKDETIDIEISINCTAEKVIKQAIDDERCNPKAEWQKLGSPDHLTRSQVEEIKSKTRLTGEEMPFITENGSTFVSLKLRTNDVVLLTFE